jgi:hypothetical protein
MHTMPVFIPLPDGDGHLHVARSERGRDRKR